MTSFISKNMIKNIRKILSRSAIVLSLIIIIFLSLFLSYLIVYKGKIYPNISVANTNISGMKLNDAINSLSTSISPISKLTLKYQDQNFEIQTSDIDYGLNITESAIEAYKYTRSGNIIYDFGNRINLLFKHKNFGLITSINEEKLDKRISVIAGQISESPVKPSLVKTDGKLSVNNGTPGTELDQNKLKGDIINNLSFDIKDSVNISVKNIDETLNNDESLKFLQRGENYLGKTLSINFEYKSITLKDTDLFDLINPKGTYKEDEIEKIVEKATNTFEREPQNPKFVFENGKVSEFQPALEGIKVDKDKLRQKLQENLSILENSSGNSLSFDAPVVKTKPEIATDEVNNFGIKEIIGRGASTYYHSIPGRVHNVALAAGRINGTLVKPGETFSFNSTLGDVSAFTGYQQAYIISEGKTILGDGGGVCQVSSTLFRAVLNAGLPVVERQAHAYRVGYYEQGSAPGFDATVYSPSPDFKFTNDTGSYILIAATVDSKNYSLVFELYGTKDGRVSSVSKPVVTNVSAPPADIYQDDPSLPTGTIKQVDYKAWGAKVTFRYVVTKDGKEIVNKVFTSNYKPWAAVYLRGTGPAN